MSNKQIDININDNVAKWMQDTAKWHPCQRKSYTVYVIQPPVGFVVANKLEQLTGYDFIKKEFQQVGGMKREIPFLDLRNNPERLEKVREGIKSGKLELTVVEDGRVLLCGTLGEVWTASADVVRSSYTLSDGKPVGEISKTEWMPIVRKGESAPSAKGMLLPVKYRGILETKYGTRIMNDPRVSGHNAGDILVATTKKDGSLGLSTINNTVFANTFNLIVGGWSANKLVVPSQNSAQGGLLEQLNNMKITKACAKKVVPYGILEILAMRGGDGGSSDTFQHLSQKQVDLLYKKFTIDEGMSKDDAFGEIYSIDCRLDEDGEVDEADEADEAVPTKIAPTPVKIPKGWDVNGIRKRGVEGIRKDAKRCEKFMSKIRTVGDLKAKMDKLEGYEIQDCIEVYIDGKESDQLTIDEVLEMSDDTKICSFRLEVFDKVEFPCINFKKNGDYTFYFDIYPLDYDPDNALAENVTIKQFEQAFPPSVDNTKTPSQKKLADAEKAPAKKSGAVHINGYGGEFKMPADVKNALEEFKKAHPELVTKKALAATRESFAGADEFGSLFDFMRCYNMNFVTALRQCYGTEDIKFYPDDLLAFIQWRMKGSFAPDPHQWLQDGVVAKDKGAFAHLIGSMMVWRYCGDWVDADFRFDNTTYRFLVETAQTKEQAEKAKRAFLALGKKPVWWRMALEVQISGAIFERSEDGTAYGRKVGERDFLEDDFFVKHKEYMERCRIGGAQRKAYYPERYKENHPDLPASVPKKDDEE